MTQSEWLEVLASMDNPAMSAIGEELVAALSGRTVSCVCGWSAELEKVSGELAGAKSALNHSEDMTQAMKLSFLGARQESASMLDDLTGMAYANEKMKHDIAGMSRHLQAAEDYTKKQDADLVAALKREGEAVKFIRAVESDYDCDTGSGGVHAIHCRKCTAGRILDALPSKESK